METHKDVVVTGASRGIGAAVVRLLLERGHRVLGVSRGPSSEDHPSYLHCPVDLSEPAAIEQFCTGILARFVCEATEGLALVQNAGALDPVGPVDGVESTELETALRLSVIAPHRLARTCIERGTGPLTIVQVSSGAASRAIPGWTAYCTGKAALEMLGRCLAEDASRFDHLRARRVRVLSWAPGVVDTRMQEEIRQVSEGEFPERARFEELHGSGALAPVGAVAEALLEAMWTAPTGFSQGRYAP